jgi:aspartate ammonia-lyase
MIAGELRREFVAHFVQGGAGTSVNMNANEAIANVALEYLGHAKGECQHVNPNDHVNCGQSTNDVYPTALRLARILRLSSYSSALGKQQQAFVRKGEEVQRISESRALFHEINLAATAIGTSVTAPPGSPRLAAQYLSKPTELDFVLSQDLVEATSGTRVFVQLSGGGSSARP